MIILPVSLESFECPMCKKSRMRKGKPKIKFQYISDDGTTGEAIYQFMVCPVCNNIQIMPDVIKSSSLTFDI
jgi:hypothetical protein